MMAWLVAGLLALVAALFAWGLARIRRGQAQAFAAAREVRVDQLESLLEECTAGFARLGEALDLDDADASAALLDRYLTVDMSMPLKSTFARPGAAWHFALPVGAALGEWLRRHANGSWAPAEGGGLCIVFAIEGGAATAHPFEKVVKQATIGQPGDVQAYLSTARGFGTIVPTPEPADA